MLVMILGAPALGAAAEPPLPLGLREAVEFALRHNPGLRASESVKARASAQVELARAGYLPEVDLSLQLERDTGNVLRGALFPMRNIPSVSGPPVSRTLDSGAFGSVLGASASWDVIGLLDRIARTDAALVEEEGARTGLDAQRLAVAFAAADAFIDVLGKMETVRAASASVDRAEVLARVVQTLVAQELRPGADGARAAAEVAIARTQLIRAHQAEAVARAMLAQALGAPSQSVDLAPGKLLEPPPDVQPSGRGERHPRVLEAEAALRAAEARKRAVDLEYLPRLDIVAALWVRGSGLTSGPLGPGPGDGLVPDTPNWAAGLVLTWPVLEFVAQASKDRREAAQVALARARGDEVAQAIETQIDSARAILEGARRSAANTPIALEAARMAERQLSTRYRSGLATLDDVAQAQKLLTQAEIEDALARLGVRRGGLLLAYALGDLGPFFDEVRPAVGEVGR